MPAGAFVTPVAGGSITTVWKPPVGVTPGSAGDATAPFALGSLADITPPGTSQRSLAQFCRVGATGIASGATAGITAGVTVAAASGNTWTNDTGVALVTGDYAWLTTAPVTTP